MYRKYCPSLGLGVQKTTYLRVQKKRKYLSYMFASRYPENIKFCYGLVIQVITCIFKFKFLENIAYLQVEVIRKHHICLHLGVQTSSSFLMSMCPEVTMYLLVQIPRSHHITLHADVQTSDFLQVWVSQRYCISLRPNFHKISRICSSRCSGVIADLRVQTMFYILIDLCV